MKWSEALKRKDILILFAAVVVLCLVFAFAVDWRIKQADANIDERIRVRLDSLELGAEGTAVINASQQEEIDSLQVWISRLKRAGVQRLIIRLDQ